MRKNKEDMEMKQGNWKLLVLAGIAAAALLAGCGSAKTVTEFKVEEAFHVYVEADRFSYNIQMPKVAEGVLEGDIINRQIEEYDSRTLEDWKGIAEPDEPGAADPQEGLGEETTAEGPETGGEAPLPGGSDSSVKAADEPEGETAELETAGEPEGELAQPEEDGPKPILVYVERTYLTSNQEGVCSLTILTRWIPSAEGAEAGFQITRDAVSFYYDEGRGRAVNEEEYLSLLKQSKAQILSAFQQEYGEQYADRMYTLEDIPWYYDEHGRLHFLTDRLDSMGVSDSEFVLTVGSEPFGVDGVYDFPEELPDIFETAGNEGVEQSAYWQTEQYDGVRLTYVVNQEEEGRRLYEAVVARAGHNAVGQSGKISEDQDNGQEEDREYQENASAFDAQLDIAPISTYRGVGVGDRRDYVLRMYPEIDGDVQSRNQEEGDVLTFSEGSGGRRLEFRFKEDVLVELILRNPIL